MAIIVILIFGFCLFGGIFLFLWSLLKLQDTISTVRRNQATMYNIRPPSFYLMTLIVSLILLAGVILIS